jgi:hypothetical protein
MFGLRGILENRYSWMSNKKVEKMIWDELSLRLTAPDTIKSLFTQVSRPIEFLNFLKCHNLLTRDIVLGACRWANECVYLPITRINSARRPTMFDVALIADLCREYQIPMSEISKAIRISVVVRDGLVAIPRPKPKPLKYRKRRPYLRERDGYIVSGFRPVIDIAERIETREMKSNDAAFAPRLRKLSTQPLWKHRSNSWFFRK